MAGYSLLHNTFPNLQFRFLDFNLPFSNLVINFGSQLLFMIFKFLLEIQLSLFVHFSCFIITSKG